MVAQVRHCLRSLSFSPVAIRADRSHHNNHKRTPTAPTESDASSMKCSGRYTSDTT